MIRIIAFIIAIFACGFAQSQPYTPVKKLDVPLLYQRAQTDSIQRIELMASQEFNRLINQYREENNLHNLEWNVLLWLSSRNHNNYMNRNHPKSAVFLLLTKNLFFASKKKGGYMFSLNEGNSFKVYTQGADLRKGLDGLCGLVGQSTHSPTNGDVYVFLNKTRTTMKLVHWERGGYVIYYKRMEIGRVSHKIFSAGEVGFRTMRWDEIVLYLEGINPKIKRRKRYNL